MPTLRFTCALLLAAAAACVAVPAAWPAGRAPAPRAAEPPSGTTPDMRIAAVVNDEVISVYDLVSRLRMTLLSSNIPDSQDARRKIEAQILRSLVDEKLQLQEAKKQNVVATDDEINNALAQIEKQNNMQPGQLGQFLKARGIDRTALINQVTASIVWAKLVRRKLSKPLEASLTVEHAVTITAMIDDCIVKVDEDPLLQKIAGTRAARSLLAEAKALQIPPPLRLLLTALRENDADTYAHTLLVVAVSAGIAAKLKAQPNDANALIMAAVLHDIGETYINPEYLKAKRRLAPHEWKHVVSHPRIGQVLVQDLTSLPVAIALCVGQHHERHDGSGYPYQQMRADQHRLAGWIAVADASGALLASGKGASERIALALRIVPGEYDRDAAGVLIQALRKTEDDYGAVGSSECIVEARNALIKIETVRRVLHDAAATTGQPFVRQTCIDAETLLHAIATSMRATGVLDTEMLGDSINDPELLAEMHLIVREVGWRTRNLARNIYLRAESQPGPEPLAELNGIIEMMDG